MTPEDERRTPQGALLRSGLDAVKRQALEIPKGKRGRVGVAFDADGDEVGLEVGVAWLTPQGWEVEANVSAAIARGDRLRVAGSGTITWE